MFQKETGKELKVGAKGSILDNLGEKQPARLGELLAWASYSPRRARLFLN